jgi:hypothetical protein
MVDELAEIWAENAADRAGLCFWRKSADCQRSRAVHTTPEPDPNAIHSVEPGDGPNN